MHLSDTCLIDKYLKKNIHALQLNFEKFLQKSQQYQSNKKKKNRFSKLSTLKKQTF